MINYCKINNKVWNVKVLEIEENFNILYSDNTGRVIGSGKMILDPIGTFIGHSVSFGKMGNGLDEFDELFAYLRTPRSQGIPVEMVDGQTSISYTAYVSSGSRKVRKINNNQNKVYWESFKANFIPISAQIMP